VPGSDSRRRRGLGRVLVGDAEVEGMTSGSPWSATHGAGAGKRAGGLAGPADRDAGLLCWAVRPARVGLQREDQNGLAAACSAGGLARGWVGYCGLLG
jgi:hypothetical protein